jgi:hypothetical protein
MNESNRDEDDPLFEETSSSEVGTWLQENLRVIVSVFIVGAIALGIYSYSQRTETVSQPMRSMNQKCPKPLRTPMQPRTGEYQHLLKRTRKVLVCHPC